MSLSNKQNSLCTVLTNKSVILTQYFVWFDLEIVEAATNLYRVRATLRVGYFSRKERRV